MISIDFIVELLEFVGFNAVMLVVDLVSKTVHFIPPYYSQWVLKEWSNSSYTMYRSLMASLHMLSLTGDLNLLPYLQIDSYLPLSGIYKLMDK